MVIFDYFRVPLAKSRSYPIAYFLHVTVLYHTRILYHTRMVHTIRVRYVPYAYGTILYTIRVRYDHTRIDVLRTDSMSRLLACI